MISPSSIAAAATLGSAVLEVAESVAKVASRSAGAGTALARSDGPRISDVQDRIATLLKAGRARPPARRRTRRSSGAGYAKPPPKTAPSKPGAPSKAKGASSDPLSFIRDPSLSIEEKMLRLLSFLNERWEKEMQQKMEQIEAGERGSTSAAKSSGSKKKKGLGGLGSVLKGALGIGGIALEALKNPAVRQLVGKIGGPVLAAGATALGFPQLAPLLLQHGPKLIELAAGLASSLDGAGESGSGGSDGAGKAGGGTSAGGGEKISDAKRQQLTLEIQRLYEKQKEMFGLVSNILRVGHDTRMSIVNNIR